MTTLGQPFTQTFGQASSTSPPSSGQTAPSVQSIVTNLQNLVVAVNALTTQISTQFGTSGLYTFAKLPTPTGPSRAFVSDSTVPATGNFGAAVTGGGTNTVPVYWNNLNWRIG